MKKTVLLSTLVCGSLLMGAASTTLAEEAAKEPKVKTSGHVNFQQDSGKTDPEEPPTGEKPEEPGEGEEKPGKPVEPGEKPGEPGEKPEETENDGPLTIDFASSFEFRKQNIKASAQTFYANVQEWTKGAEEQKESYYTPNFVQVTDKRAGDIKGWELDVTLASPLTNKEDGHTLEKAQIKLEERRVVSLWDTTGETKNKSAQLVGAQQDAPDLGEVVAISDEAQPLMKADVGTGWGTSQTYFATVAPEEVIEGAEYKANEDVKDGVSVKGTFLGAGDQGVSLNIPAGTNIHTGDYTAKILWSLSNAPK